MDIQKIKECILNKDNDKLLSIIYDVPDQFEVEGLWKHANAIFPMQWRPLHFAAMIGDPFIVEILLGVGADPTFTNENGLCPYQVATTLDAKKKLTF